MAKNEKTSALVDGTLRFLAAGGVIAAAIIAPNIVQVLDKPLQRYFKKLDKRAQEREMKHVLTYMKKQHLITYGQNYAYGIQLTQAGRKRLTKLNIEKLSIPKPKRWDKKWRLVFFDIPEQHRQGRKALAYKLRQLGFYQLQRSVWLHPFPCRPQIEYITSTYKINRFVSYIETPHIDQQERLINKFKLTS